MVGHQCALCSTTVTAQVRPSISPITIEDINQASQHLVSLKLPLEIAAIILDYAEYWYIQRFGRKTPIELVFCADDLPEVSTLYLQTDAIGTGNEFDELATAKPQKVVFRTISGTGEAPCDESLLGRYTSPARCYSSWFDISIFREDESWPGKNDRQEPVSTLFHEAPSDILFGSNDDMDIESLLKEGNSASVDNMFFYWWRAHPDPRNEDFDVLPLWLYFDLHVDRSKIKGGFIVVPNGSKQRWLLQRNAKGSHKVKEHRVEWTTAEVQEDDWAKDGAGKGCNFVNSLRRGDRIAVWARSDDSENHVQEVEVDIYYSIF